MLSGLFSLVQWSLTLIYRITLLTVDNKNGYAINTNHGDPPPLPFQPCRCPSRSWPQRPSFPHQVQSISITSSWIPTPPLAGSFSEPNKQVPVLPILERQLFLSWALAPAVMCWLPFLITPSSIRTLKKNPALISQSPRKPRGTRSHVLTNALWSPGDTCSPHTTCGTHLPLASPQGPPMHLPFLCKCHRP